MKRSLLSIALPFFLFSLLLTGCGQPVKEKNTITIWHWMNDRHETFLKLAKQYEEQTGVKVSLELYAPSDAYSQKIIAAAQAKILPDIYGILGEKKTFASFIESGFVADLTGDFKANNGEWEGVFFPRALAVNKFEEGNVYKIKPGIYGVPLDVTNIQMLYNENLLKQAGIEKPPKTFPEFLEAIGALKLAGINGFVSGWGEVWMIDCFASNYAFNIMGEDKVMATYRGQVPYTDPDWLLVFQLFKDLTDHGAFISGIVTKGNKYAEQDFALERAAFAFNGSWCVNVYRDMNPNLKYGAMPPPRINNSQPMKIWGGAGSSFVVNHASKNKKLAIDFLKWLTAKDQQAVLSKETFNLPSNRQALSSIPKVLSEFAGAMEDTTHPSIWPVNENSLVVEAFDKGIQAIIIGEKTPEQAAQEIQNIKERELAKAKKREGK